MAKRFFALAAFAAGAALSTAAGAEQAAQPRAVRAAVVVQQALTMPAPRMVLQAPEFEFAPITGLSARLTPLTLSLARFQSESTQGPSKAPRAKSCTPATSCGYRALLAELVITRDLEIPGAPGMAVRLIPTRSAIAGETASPVVFKPRVVGSDWYGLDVAARF
jgi:hypothetical protein